MLIFFNTEVSQALSTHTTFFCIVLMIPSTMMRHFFTKQACLLSSSQLRGLPHFSQNNQMVNNYIKFTHLPLDITIYLAATIKPNQPECDQIQNIFPFQQVSFLDRLVTKNKHVCGDATLFHKHKNKCYRYHTILQYYPVFILLYYSVTVSLHKYI